MKSRTLKFLVTDSVITLLLIIALVCDFSAAGLVGVLLFSGLLFLGTMADKNKSWLGVANKFAYVLFCTLMGLLFIVEGALIEKGSTEFEIGFAEDVPTITVGVVLILIFIVMAILSANLNFHYAIRVPLRYGGLIMLMTGLETLLGFEIGQMILTDGLIAFFMMCDVFSCMLRVDRFGDEQGRLFDKGYWMAFGVAWALLISMMISAPYWKQMLGVMATDTLQGVTGGLNIPVFVIVMLTLAAVYLFADIKENTGNIFDSYLPTALAAFSLVLAFYATDGTVAGLVVLLLTAAALAGVGLWTVALSHTTHPENGVRITVIRTLITDGVGLLIGGAGVFSLLLVRGGYLVSVIIFICMVALVLVSQQILKGMWIADSVKWQLILAAEFAIALSMAIIDRRSGGLIVCQIMAFLITSLGMWGLGVRAEKDNRFLMLSTRILDCVLLGAILLFTVLSY